MYMALSFMVHVAMHWCEDQSDDLSLWSFVVDYAARLYNHIPHRRSGIPPINLQQRQSQIIWI
ncbi:hypothetical protein ACHAW6_000357 [Cyclotella cf. meneghiniana]